MLAEFEYLYNSQLRPKSALRGPNPEAVVSGPVTEVDAHSELFFVAACRQVFNAWNAAGVLNPHVRSFNGTVIPKLISAIEFTPSNRYARIQSLNVAYSELRHAIDQLQNLVNVKNGGKLSNFAEMSDDETPNAILPEWNNDSRTLSFAGNTVRQYSPSIRENVRHILNSFQECGWPVRIDDPLSPSDGEKTKLALRTINNGLTGLLFSKDGDGIKWAVTAKVEMTSPELTLNSP